MIYAEALALLSTLINFPENVECKIRQRIVSETLRRGLGVTGHISPERFRYNPLN